jgi:nitrite reductase/ring-hydroxylating ferredoxin subunit/ectoine hydroxylase-related dioxygenase (phytanoyl-CoA dioxygenase family)
MSETQVVIKSLLNPDDIIGPQEVAGRLHDGDILVVRGCLKTLGIEDEVHQLTRHAIENVLDQSRCERVLSAGIESLHEHASADEVLDIAERVYQAMHENCLEIGALLARRILHRRRSVYVERTPNVRFHVPYNSEARARGGMVLEQFRKRRGEGKVTPHASHRDSWFNCPTDGLNFWIALGRVIPGNGLVFYPEVYRKPVVVDPQHHVCEGARLGAPVTIDLEPGDAVLFAGEQLHASELNRTNLTRYAVSYRLTLKKPYFPGKHIHHYALTGLRHGFLARWAEWPARLQLSFLRQKLGAMRAAKRLPGFLRTKSSIVPNTVVIQQQKRGTSPDAESLAGIQAEAIPHGVALAVNESVCAAKDTDGTVFFFARRCPHEGADLAGARVSGERVVCPWHNVSFNIRTGAGCEGLRPLRPYPAAH